MGATGTILCWVAVMYIYGYGQYKLFIIIIIFKRSFLVESLVAVIDIVPYTSADCRDFAMIAPRWTDTTTYYLPEAVGFLGVWSTTMYELMVWISRSTPFSAPERQHPRHPRASPSPTVHALRRGRGDRPPRLLFPVPGNRPRYPIPGIRQFKC